MNDIYSQQNIDFLKNDIKWLENRLNKYLTIDNWRRPLLEDLLKERKKELEKAKMYFNA